MHRFAFLRQSSPLRNEWTEVRGRKVNPVEGGAVKDTGTPNRSTNVISERFTEGRKRYVICKATNTGAGVLCLVTLYFVTVPTTTKN